MGNFKTLTFVIIILTSIIGLSSCNHKKIELIHIKGDYINKEPHYKRATKEIFFQLKHFDVENDADRKEVDALVFKYFNDNKIKLVDTNYNNLRVSCFDTGSKIDSTFIRSGGGDFEFEIFHDKNMLVGYYWVDGKLKDGIGYMKDGKDINEINPSNKVYDPNKTLLNNYLGMK